MAAGSPRGAGFWLRSHEDWDNPADPERSIGKHDDPFGGDFLDKVASTPAKTRDARLRNINKALKIAIPQFDSLTLQQDGGGRWHLEARFSHWRQSAARQYERSFSDGTLRLIGLLWSLAEGGGPLLLEEPELALHDALVRHLPRFMAQMHTKSGRQVLITTHSAALLADAGIGLDEVHVLDPDSQGTEIKVGRSYPAAASPRHSRSAVAGYVLLERRISCRYLLFIRINVRRRASRRSGTEVGHPARCSMLDPGARKAR